MIGRLISALAYGLLVGIVVLVVGLVLGSVGVKPLAVLGGALVEFCWAIGLLVAILAFFGNWSIRP